MNTKTSHKSVHNFYDGSNHGVGRDSPGALLDMLAEVASQTLHSEAKDIESDITITFKQKSDTAKRKAQEVHMNLPQILSMPVSKLVKHFAVFTSDELKRQYSYMCALVPGCQQKYTSFASEGKARISITTHLVEHLDTMRNNEDFYNTFKATSVKCSKSRAGIQAKKNKAQLAKKPQETLNKENTIGKSEKSTSYLRKILSNEMNFKEFENQKKLEDQNRRRETCAMETKKNSNLGMDFKVLGDHSYYEQTKTELVDVEVMQQEAVNEAMAENIMLMVVENNTVHIKEMPYLSEGVTGQSNQECNSNLMGSKSWSGETLEKSTETTIPSKPKGKAKFIGTSKEEREMALVLIDRIKKKGNPSGENLQCRICDPPRSFTAPTTLVSHYRSHAGIKPYECRICRSVFTRRHSLKYHMLIHQNQTRFTCGDCGKKFRHPSHFREHRRRHTGESPFGCEDCGQRFKTRNTYKRHLKTRHGKVLTTTGELLRLTEEEFQKVQTNRKRKCQTRISSDATPDEDIAATEAIVECSTVDFNENDRENNNESIEDYHVQAMVAHRSSEDIVDACKTITIETDATASSNPFPDDDEEDDDDDDEDDDDDDDDDDIDTVNRIIYDDDQTQYVESTAELLQTASDDERNERNFDSHPGLFEEVEHINIPGYKEEISQPDEDAYIVAYEDIDEDYLDDESEATTDPSIDVTSNVPATSDTDDVTYPDDNSQSKRNDATRLKVKYACKIRGNVNYRTDVVDRENYRYDDTENYEGLDDDDEINLVDPTTGLLECRSTDVTNNNNDSCDVRRSSESDNDDSRVNPEKTIETTKVSPERKTNIGAVVKKGTIFVLSKESLKSGYLRIASKNIVVKEVNPLSTIAVHQK